MTDFTTVAPNSSVGSNAPGLPPIDLATVPAPRPRLSLTVGPKVQLVPVDHDPFAETSATNSKLVPVDHDPFAEPSMMDTAADTAKSAGIGLAKGAIGIAGIPGDLQVAADRGVDWLAEKFMTPENFQSYLKANEEGRKPLLPTSRDLTEKVEGVTGPLYDPKTTPGKIAQTAAEFVPGAALGGVAGIARRALIGGAAGAGSEVAGQLTEGTPLEPWMRLGTALGIGGVTAMMTQPRTAQRFIRAQMPDYVNDQAVTHADAMIRDAGARGITLTWPEALSQVTGRPVLTDMQRILEGSKQTRAPMQQALGDRPAQIRAAAEREVANIAPPTAQPSTIGPATGAAAEGHLGEVRQAINRVSEPFYDRAKTFRLSRGEMAQVRAIPGYAKAARAVRKDPQLNREVAHLPEDSIGFLNEVKKVLDQMAENAASPVQQGRSVQRAAGLGRDAQAVRDAAINAEAAAGEGNYAQALNIQETARQRYLEPLLQGPLGKLADRNTTTKNAIEALFPAEPVAGSEHEISTAVAALSRSNPGVARQLVRAHVEAKLNEAFDAAGRGQEAAGFAGAGLAQRLTGSPIVNTQRGENFRAAVEALPGGRQLWPGIERFLEIARATGARQPIGSKTAFNEAELHGLATGKSIANLAKTAASPGEWWHAAHEMWGKWQTGNNLAELARIITDPRSEAVFRRLASSPGGAREAVNMAARITVGIGLGSKTAAEDRAKRGQ
jgi:hypothetical protein